MGEAARKKKNRLFFLFFFVSIFFNYFFFFFFETKHADLQRSRKNAEVCCLDLRVSPKCYIVSFCTVKSGFLKMLEMLKISRREKKMSIEGPNGPYDLAARDHVVAAGADRPASRSARRRRRDSASMAPASAETIDLVATLSSAEQLQQMGMSALARGFPADGRRADALFRRSAALLDALLSRGDITALPAPPPTPSPSRPGKQLQYQHRKAAAAAMAAAAAQTGNDRQPSVPFAPGESPRKAAGGGDAAARPAMISGGVVSVAYRGGPSYAEAPGDPVVGRTRARSARARADNMAAGSGDGGSGAAAAHTNPASSSNGGGHQPSSSAGPRASSAAVQTQAAATQRHRIAEAAAAAGIDPGAVGRWRTDHGRTRDPTFAEVVARKSAEELRRATAAAAPPEGIGRDGDWAALCVEMRMVELCLGPAGDTAADLIGNDAVERWGPVPEMPAHVAASLAEGHGQQGQHGQHGQHSGGGGGGGSGGATAQTRVAVPTPMRLLRKMRAGKPPHHQQQQQQPQQPQQPRGSASRPTTPGQQESAGGSYTNSPANPRGALRHSSANSTGSAATLTEGLTAGSPRRSGTGGSQILPIIATAGDASAQAEAGDEGETSAAEIARLAAAAPRIDARVARDMERLRAHRRAQRKSETTGLMRRNLEALRDLQQRAQTPTPTPAALLSSGQFTATSSGSLASRPSSRAASAKSGSPRRANGRATNRARSAKDAPDHAHAAARSTHAHGAHATTPQQQHQQQHHQHHHQRPWDDEWADPCAAATSRLATLRWATYERALAAERERLFRTVWRCLHGLGEALALQARYTDASRVHRWALAVARERLLKGSTQAFYSELGLAHAHALAGQTTAADDIYVALVASLGGADNVVAIATGTLDPSVPIGPRPGQKRVPAPREPGESREQAEARAARALAALRDARAAALENPLSRDPPPAHVLALVLLRAALCAHGLSNETRAYTLLLASLRIFDADTDRGAIRGATREADAVLGDVLDALGNVVMDVHGDVRGAVRWIEREVEVRDVLAGTAEMYRLVAGRGDGNDDDDDDDDDDGGDDGGDGDGDGDGGGGGDGDDVGGGEDDDAGTGNGSDDDAESGDPPGQRQKRQQKRQKRKQRQRHQHADPSTQQPVAVATKIIGHVHPGDAPLVADAAMARCNLALIIDAGSDKERALALLSEAVALLDAAGIAADTATLVSHRAPAAHFNPTNTWNPAADDPDELGLVAPLAAALVHRARVLLAMNRPEDASLDLIRARAMTFPRVGVNSADAAVVNLLIGRVHLAQHAPRDAEPHLLAAHTAASECYAETAVEHPSARGLKGNAAGRRAQAHARVFTGAGLSRA
jgi:uncharacterized membrane protein YgcG